MQILNKTELQLRLGEFIQKIEAGAIFIYPTDTIYGIGCDATNEKAVQKIRELKERPDNPFSVWAPSLSWIKKNCQVNKAAEEWLNKLPGPYTLLLKQKKSAVAKNVNPNLKTIGVRIPDHWFNHVVKELKIPIVTTSVNKAGEMFMTDKDNLDPEIKMNVDFLIYEGEKTGRPSQIVDLVKGTVKER